MAQNNGERGANFFEKFYICRSINKFGSTVNMTAKYNNRVNKVLLSNALRSFIMKNSRLFSNFFTNDTTTEIAKNNGSNFLLKSVSKIMYEDIVESIELEESFNENTIEMLNSVILNINKDAPLWKLFIHENSREQYLTFCFNHTLFDGNSGKHFHEDLIKELEYFSKQDNLALITVLFNNAIDMETAPILPSDSDKIVDFYKSGKFFIFKELISLIFIPEWIKTFINIFRKKLPNIYNFPIFQTFPTSRESKTKYKLIKIYPNDLDRILKRCKAENFTMTPYITSVAMYALQEKVFSHWGFHKPSFHITIAADGRRYILEDQFNTRYGLFIAGIDTFFGPFIGDKIRQIGMVSIEIHNKIITNLNNQNPFKFAGLLRLVNIWDYLNNKIGKKNRETISVSNLGMLNVPTNNWSIEDLIFTQSNGIYTHFGISSVSTKTGGLNICFGYLEEDNKSFEGKEIIDDFLLCYKESLLKAI